MSLDPINLYDYEARAKQVLSHNTWDFIDAGSMDMFTTRRNRTAFEELTLRPRFLRDIGEIDISTTVLGQEISLPVMIAPAGSHMVAHPEGELAPARGAGMSDTLRELSTSSTVIGCPLNTALGLVSALKRWLTAILANCSWVVPHAYMWRCFISP